MRRSSSRFGLEVVLVNVWEHLDARNEALHFCRIHGIEGPVLLDEEGTYIERLGLRGVPMNVVVDEAGIVRAVGATTPEELEEVLAKLLPLRG